MRLVVTAFAFYILTLAVRVYAAEPICTVLLGRTKQSSIELLAYSGGYQIGYLHYRTYGENQAAVNVISVDQEYKRKGISKALFHGMLLRDPQIKTISAVLIKDNFQASGLQFKYRYVTNAECMAAAMRTPLYRALSRYGFTRVLSCEFAPSVPAMRIEIGRE